MNQHKICSQKLSHSCAVNYPCQHIGALKSVLIVFAGIWKYTLLSWGRPIPNGLLILYCNSISIKRTMTSLSRKLCLMELSSTRLCEWTHPFDVLASNAPADSNDRRTSAKIGKGGEAKRPAVMRRCFEKLWTSLDSNCSLALKRFMKWLTRTSICKECINWLLIRRWGDAWSNAHWMYIWTHRTGDFCSEIFRLTDSAAVAQITFHP